MKVPKTLIKNSLVLTLLVLPLIIFAQSDVPTTAIDALDKNNDFITQLGQLAPMGINPYIAVFMTSLFSKMGIHNDFVADHPFYDSWIVLVVFGILFMYTAIIGTVINSSKIAKPFGLADSWLTDKAGIIIQVAIVLIPAFMSNDPQLDTDVIQAGVFSFSLRTILMLLASVYFLIVVSTVRMFIDILIFLSPVPLIDAVLSISKIVFTIILVLVSILSPITSFVITLFLFVIGLMLFNRARRLVTRTQYLFVYPIIGLFSSKSVIEGDEKEIQIQAMTAQKLGKIKKGKLVQLEKSGTTYRILKKRFLFPSIKEEIALSDGSLSQKSLKIEIINKDASVLILNRRYFKHIDAISTYLELPIHDKSKSTPQTGGLLSRMKGMFSKEDVALLRS